MDQTTGIILVCVLGGIFLGVAIFIPLLFAQKNEKQFQENHKKIYLGMSKDEVIDILGEQYTQSYLKNNIEKLEWRYRHQGYTGRVAEGAYVHSSGFTRRISVKFKDGIVIEVNSLNMD